MMILNLEKKISYLVPRLLELFYSYHTGVHGILSLPCIHKRNQITPLFFLRDCVWEQRERERRSEYNDEGMHKKRKRK